MYRLILLFNAEEAKKFGFAVFQLNCTYVLKHTSIATKDEVELSISLVGLLHGIEINIYQKINVRNELGASLLFDRLFLRQFNRKDLQTI